MDIKDRLCPSCRENIGIYSAIGLYMPLEGEALYRIMDSDKETSQTPFLPIGMSSPAEWYSIVLSATCKKCGHISLWKATKHDLEILTNPENVSKGFGFWQSYEPKMLQRVLEHIEDPQIKQAVKDILEQSLRTRGQ